MHIFFFVVYACVIWLTAEPTRHTPLTFDWNQQYGRSLSFFFHSSTENSNARDLYIFRPHLNAICVGGNSQIHPHETNNNEISMQQNWILSYQFWHSIELNRLEICHVCNIVVLIFRPHATQVTLYNQMPSLASFFYIFFCIFVVFRLLKSWVEPLNTGSDQNQSLFILIESLEIPLCLETCMMLFYGIQAIPQGWSMWLHPIFSASNVMQVVFFIFVFFCFFFYKFSSIVDRDIWRKLSRWRCQWAWNLMQNVDFFHPHGIERCSISVK